MIFGIAQDVIPTRVDFIHFPLAYYFYAVTERAALPEALSHLLAVARRGCSTDRPERVRVAAATLQNALEDFAEVLANRFVQADARDPQAVFEAFKEDHLIAELKENRSGGRAGHES